MRASRRSRPTFRMSLATVTRASPAKLATLAGGAPPATPRWAKELRYPPRSCRLLERVVQAAPGPGVHLQQALQPVGLGLGHSRCDPSEVGPIDLRADPRCHAVEGAVAGDLAAPRTSSSSA